MTKNAPRSELQTANYFVEYMIYLDSAGCFEVIVESWAVDEEGQNV